MRKGLLLTGVSALALCAGKSAATAADMRMPAYKAPPPAPAPVFSWTGCYVGPHVGWGWSRHKLNQSRTFSGSFGVTTQQASGNIDASGAVFGGQLGCNYQFNGNWVIGVQGDVAAADINGDHHNFLLPGDDDSHIQIKTDWLASITGRLGWAVNQTLFYVKGGGAWAHNRYAINDSIGDNPSATLTGWTIGGGVEAVIFGNWTAFAEFDYYDFSSKTVNYFQTSNCSNVVVCPGIPSSLTDKQSIEEFKIGVNYKFN